ncbi:MAG: hypothetical protein JXM79_11585 [Sedimentisphaerales bacterium]|nr:hypothetical protein [Sedimentisphaerales bacterium]
MRRRFDPMPDVDPIRSKFVDGTLSQFLPGDDEALAGQDGLKWKNVDLDDKGAVAERGSYLYVPYISEKQSVLVLNASGHSEAYVNGELHGGDVYNRGDVHLPVLMNEGTNQLFFQAGRGTFKVRLYEPPSPVFLLEADTTVPDLVAGETVDTWGAVIVMNATREQVEGFTLTIDAPGIVNKATQVPSIPLLSIRKVGFRIQGTAPSEPGLISCTLKLHEKTGCPSHRIPLTLEAIHSDQPRKITFVSDIDGSVQYFALRSATPLSHDDPAPAIVLSCHGAGVQAIGQSRAYSTKSWFHLVAPTNRRPYGYDWEDFDRMDAMEVLDIARKSLKHDPSRIYLTGHSMGEHGAWHLGVTYRGNGSVEILPDSAFESSRYPDRTVVLYGNAVTNKAWSSLLSNSPIQVLQGQVQIGKRSLKGEDLAAFFIQPRKDSDITSVIAVSGSGPTGMRSAYSVSFFRSFVRYPDCLVTRMSPEEAGRTENVAAGFFGLDWSVKNGEFSFSDETETATP